MNPTEEIRTLLEEQASCWNRGELDRYLSYYAEDAVYLPGGDEPLHGAEAIVRSLKARYGFDTRPPGRLTYERLFSRLVALDLAIAVGRYRLEPGGSAFPRTGQFSLVLRRRAWTWEIILDHPT
jgi:uncharacterized protein (TIGR02246 family)